MNEEFLKFIEDTIEWLEELEDKCKTEEEWPKVRDDYWTIDIFGEVVRFSWLDDPVDNIALNNNAIFKTKEEAEFEAERLKVLRELEKMGRPFEPNEHNLSVCYNYRTRGIDILGYTITHSVYGDFYFSTQREAEQAIEKIGEDRIKKFLFKVEG